MPLQEALGFIIDYALDNEDELVERLKGLPPLEEDPAWKMLMQPRRWGIRDASRRMDEFLYGR